MTQPIPQPRPINLRMFVAASAPNGAQGVPLTVQPVTPPVQPDQQPPIQPLPSLPPPPSQSFSAADLDRVRQEEKKKLYGQLEQLQNEVRQLRDDNARFQSLVTSQQPNAPSPEFVQMRADNETLRHQVQQLGNTLQQYNDALVTEREQRRVAQLHAYMTQRISEVQGGGFGLVVEMIGGNTTQEIEQSIYDANVAYNRYVSQVQQPQPRQAVSVRASQSIANGFPTVVQPVPVVGQDAGTDGFIADVHELTSPEAVRSGAYAQNRSRVLDTLKARGAGVAAVPMHNTPRLLPSGQPVHEWAGVQQPQGLPTPPVMNPNMPQQLPPPQRVMNPPQMVQMPPPVGGSFVDQAQAEAIAAAQRGLGNPGGQRAPLPDGQRYAGHAEYGNAPPQQIAPHAFTNQHPMIRNSG